MAMNDRTETTAAAKRGALTGWRAGTRTARDVSATHETTTGVCANLQCALLIRGGDADTDHWVGALNRALGIAWHVVTVRDVDAGLHLMPVLTPHVVLLDIAPGQKTVSPALRSITEQAPDIPVLVLLHEGQSTLGPEALRDGACDCVQVAADAAAVTVRSLQCAIALQLLRQTLEPAEMAKTSAP